MFFCEFALLLNGIAGITQDVEGQGISGWSRAFLIGVDFKYHDIWSSSTSNRFRSATLGCHYISCGIEMITIGTVCRQGTILQE